MNTTQIKTKIEDCIKCIKSRPQLLNRCLYMVNKYIDQPWNHTTIKMIMYTEENWQGQFVEGKNYCDLCKFILLLIRLEFCWNILIIFLTTI